MKALKGGFVPEMMTEAMLHLLQEQSDDYQQTTAAAVSPVLGGAAQLTGVETTAAPVALSDGREGADTGRQTAAVADDGDDGSAHGGDETADGTACDRTGTAAAATAPRAPSKNAKGKAQQSTEVSEFSGYH